MSRLVWLRFNDDKHDFQYICIMCVTQGIKNRYRKYRWYSSRRKLFRSHGVACLLNRLYLRRGREDELIFVKKFFKYTLQTESVTWWHIQLSPGLGRFSPVQIFVRRIPPDYIKFSPGHVDNMIFKDDWDIKRLFYFHRGNFFLLCFHSVLAISGIFTGVINFGFTGVFTGSGLTGSLTQGVKLYNSTDD